MQTMKKITKATGKSFIKKNRGALLLATRAKFDAMQDMVVFSSEQQFEPIRPATYFCRDACQYVNVREDNESCLGIAGVWFVGSGGDRCQAYETETHIGYTVWNCCGEWTVAITK
jgi:hypothetical protein